MEPYTIIMFVFAIALLIPALLLSLGEGGWLHSFDKSKVKDKKLYAKFIGRVILLFAAIFFISGLISLIINVGLSVVILIIGFVSSMAYAIKNAGKYYC